MKNIIAAVLILLSFTSAAIACDPALAKYQRDCQIQDRFTKIRAQLSAQNIDINQIAEYKVLRFIDRKSWEHAKYYRKAPVTIYNPAPDTWRVWEKGIDSLFRHPSFKGLLFQNVKLDAQKFSEINQVLLTDGITNIKDIRSDQNKKPGSYRTQRDKRAGFCTLNRPEVEKQISSSEESMRRFQQIWEDKSGVSLEKIQRYYNLYFPQQTLGMQSFMSATQQTCGTKAPGTFVSFSPSLFVSMQVSLITAFINANLKAYKENRSVLSPIELAVVVQKWFVSVHPFADGNGRTSRAIQDMIMANFDLPFAPSGDLQNDALEDIYTYIDNTYQKIESMLDILESCARMGTNRTQTACRTVEELNYKALPQTVLQ